MANKWDQSEKENGPAVRRACTTQRKPSSTRLRCRGHASCFSPCSTTQRDPLATRCQAMDIRGQEFPKLGSAPS